MRLLPSEIYDEIYKYKGMGLENEYYRKLIKDFWERDRDFRIAIMSILAEELIPNKEDKWM